MAKNLRPMYREALGTVAARIVFIWLQPCIFSPVRSWLSWDVTSVLAISAGIPGAERSLHSQLYHSRGRVSTPMMFFPLIDELWKNGARIHDVRPVWNGWRQARRRPLIWVTRQKSAGRLTIRSTFCSKNHGLRRTQMLLRVMCGSKPIVKQSLLWPRRILSPTDGPDVDMRPAHSAP